VCVEVDVEVPDAEAVAVLEMIDVGVGFDELETVGDEEGDELVDGECDTDAVSLVEGLVVTDTDAEGLEEELGLAVADTDADEEGVGRELNVEVGVEGGPIWQ
jgi:hypothetical protein